MDQNSCHPSFELGGIAIYFSDKLKVSEVHCTLRILYHEMHKVDESYLEGPWDRGLVYSSVFFLAG